MLLPPTLCSPGTVKLKASVYPYCLSRAQQLCKAGGHHAGSLALLSSLLSDICLHRGDEALKEVLPPWQQQRQRQQRRQTSQRMHLKRLVTESVTHPSFQGACFGTWARRNHKSEKQSGGRPSSSSQDGGRRFGEGHPSRGRPKTSRV